MSNEGAKINFDVNKLHIILAKFSKSLENKDKMCYNVLRTCLKLEVMYFYLK